MQTETDSGSRENSPERLTISVIMPVYNAAHLLPRVLDPLISMRARGEIEEIILVDDRSSDDSGRVARDFGCQVYPSGGRLGPGGARNIAAEHARGDLLWFVDSDVIVHENAARIVRSSFNDPAVVSVFGSYDDSPSADNFLSQYKNLVHHFYHHQGSEDASTFWAGCGVVRRDAFLSVGGFDVERYKYPSIEDIELGQRLRAAGGRIRLVTALQATHLKEWRLMNLIHTEIFRRAIPWSRLILSSGDTGADLNVASGERMRAVIAAALLLSFVLAVFGFLPWWSVIAILMVAILVNSRLAKLFVKRNGILFAMGGLLFHQLYYLYSSASFAWCYFTQPFVSHSNPKPSR